MHVEGIEPLDEMSVDPGVTSWRRAVLDDPYPTFCEQEANIFCLKPLGFGGYFVHAAQPRLS